LPGCRASDRITASGCCQRARQGLFKNERKRPPHPAERKSGRKTKSSQRTIFSPPVQKKFVAYGKGMIV
jgi:hypothetical protein